MTDDLDVKEKSPGLLSPDSIRGMEGFNFKLVWNKIDNELVPSEPRFHGQPEFPVV